MFTFSLSSDVPIVYILVSTDCLTCCFHHSLLPWIRSGFLYLKTNFLFFKRLLLEDTQFSLHKLKNKTVPAKENKNLFLTHFIPFKNSSIFSIKYQDLDKNMKSCQLFSLLKRLQATKYTCGHVYKWVSSTTEICYPV